MNILALDCAVTRISLAVKTESKFISTTYDIGMRQSEILVPAIDEILKKAEISSSSLNATCLTIGPGSFTGLRLGISALKAIELAYGVPVYGISSLETYAFPYSNFKLPLLSCIDANKDKFYARLSDGEKLLLKDDDYEIDTIFEAVKDIQTLLVCGPDAQKLCDKLISEYPEKSFLHPQVPAQTAEALITITEELIEKKAEPLKDFDGPVYLRASEAELKLNAAIS
jgi:tRNA threonylcarbamoyladenosine biosynthesis protein TsaB